MVVHRRRLPMKKNIAPLLLLVLGVIVIVAGQRRSDSVTGVADTMGAKIANAWDGKARQPDHVWYYIGGGALIVAGLALALRNKPGA